MPKRILLVEDDDTFATVIIYNLRACGFEVEWMQCGIKASERLCSASPPDLVVLDWNLPRLAGSEVLRRIRRDRRIQVLPVIMLTCHAERSNRELAYRLGVTDFVAKESPIKALISRIQSILSCPHPVVAFDPAE